MAEEPSRKLAVLLHADVVGSTALVQLDETLAHQRIQDTFRRFSETIASHGGCAHEIRGDALVAEFARVSDAIMAAIAFQEANATHNERLTDAIRPTARVGIAMGEVVIADNTVTGEGIVLAQRLEQLSKPGGVCLQGAAYETIPKHLPFVFTSLGEHSLKGFSEPVRVYGVKGQNLEPLPVSESLGETLALELPGKPSIAVLPFNNLGGSSDQEYFADGMAEELALALGYIKSLFVVAKSSSFVYKNRTVDVRQIGRELGVHYVLEGSVRKSGRRLRIMCELIDTANGKQIWAGRFEGSLEEIFSLQDRVTAEVVSAIEPQLQSEEIARSRAKPVSNLNAYDCYLRALPDFQTLTETSSTESLRQLTRALELDPSFARAKSLASWCYTMRRTQGWDADFEEERSSALCLAREALTGAQDDSQVLWQAGYALAYFDDATDEGLRLISRSLELNPNSAQAWVTSGLMRLFLGDAASAIMDIQKGLRLSPLDPLCFRAQAAMGLAHLCARDFATAKDWCERAIVSGPQYFVGHRVLAASLAWLGREEQARRALDRFLALYPDYTVCQFERTTPLRYLEYRKIMAEGLLKAGLVKGN